MKKIISLVLILACIITVIPFSEVSADYVYPSDLCDVNNIFLSYTFLASNPSLGHRSVKQYEPLVGYYDTNGKLVDSYFDSYLYLPCVNVAPSGGYIYYSEKNPSNFSDWQAFVDDCFLDGYNIPALNQAVKEFKQKMGKGYENYKAKVFLTCLYPVQTQTKFGDIDGDGKNDSLAVYENRVKALQWMVDEQIKRFNSGKYENLELVGFYWFEETVYNEPKGKQIIMDFNSIVHKAGLKTIWIPYFTASSKEMWRTLGFDVACLQPNYMFYDVTDTRVADACAYASKNGMCIEVESYGDVLTKATLYNKYLAYLEGCIRSGADKAIKMYYNDAVPGVYYSSYASSDPRARSVYDLTYKFAKGKLKLSDINYIENAKPFSMSDYDIVTIGKPYTASTPYTDTTADYGKNDGKELTDGILGNKSFGTEWHSFHVSYKDKDGGFSATIDLGEVEKGLNFFAAEFQQEIQAGIALPSNVYFDVSLDGVEYTTVGTATLSNNDGAYDYHIASLKSEKAYDARFIRMRMTPGNRNFVFCSEFMAGRTRLNGDKGFTNVALGKHYTASKPYTDTNLDYAQNDGKELTDGIYGDSYFGTEWHSFHISGIGEGEPYTVLLDLGKEYGCLSCFTAEFENNYGASIGMPKWMKCYASVDGEEFVPIGQAVPKKKDDFIYEAVLNTSTLVSARYIKFEIDRGDRNFVFCSEITAEQNKYYLEDPDTDPRLIGLSMYDGIPLGMTMEDFNREYTGKYTAIGLLNGRYIVTGTVITNGITSFTAVVKGDINSDGRVNAADYLIARRSLKGTYEMPTRFASAAADIDGNGMSQNDCKKIKEHILGKYNIFGGITQ